MRVVLHAATPLKVHVTAGYENSVFADCLSLLRRLFILLDIELGVLYVIYFPEYAKSTIL